MSGHESHLFGFFFLCGFFFLGGASTAYLVWTVFVGLPTNTSTISVHYLLILLLLFTPVTCCDCALLDAYIHHSWCFQPQPTTVFFSPVSLSSMVNLPPPPSLLFFFTLWHPVIHCLVCFFYVWKNTGSEKCFGGSWYLFFCVLISATAATCCMSCTDSGFVYRVRASDMLVDLDLFYLTNVHLAVK